MATWLQLGHDSLLAARKLSRDNHLRSSVSRAYYAAYSAVAHHMVEHSVDFPHGWDNPAHDQAARWLAGDRSWPAQDRRRLAQAMQRLRKAREDADYRPGISLAKSDVIKSLNEAGVIFRLLGVDDENTQRKQEN